MTKEHLVRLLGEDDNKVIALSGKWGTGKSHLWDEVKRESGDDKIRKALYVSLFGQSSIDQVKRKLIESAIPAVESHSGTFDVLKNFFKVGVKAGSEHYKALAAINDLNFLLMAPAVLRNSVIVIDDIERKHEKLGIDEVLGFIDEYSKQYDARFVLILNDDNLSKPELWNTFREKVIDQELKLITTPNEAFDIAIKLTPSLYQDALKQASFSCELTNIRVVGRIIKVANRILGERELDEAILARVVPSIVLFSAIHYRGLEDGPDFQFALNEGQRLSYLPAKGEEDAEEHKRKDRWRLLMQELGVHSCDEFEALLVEFLESGLFDPTKVAESIDRFITNKDSLEAREKVNELLFRAVWDHRVDDAQLVADAASFSNIVALLNPFTVSELDRSLKSLDGGSAVGETLIKEWIAAYRARNNSNEVSGDVVSNPQLHPEIRAVFAETNAGVEARTTVVDVCMHIIENSGWGPMQEVVMKRATRSDFELAIREMDIKKLQRFMRRMMEMRFQRQNYVEHFGTAIERFVEACGNIANDESSPKLAGLIKSIFAGTAIASELEPEEPSEATSETET